MKSHTRTNWMFLVYCVLVETAVASTGPQWFESVTVAGYTIQPDPGHLDSTHYIRLDTDNSTDHLDVLTVCFRVLFHLLPREAPVVTLVDICNCSDTTQEQFLKVDYGQSANPPFHQLQPMADLVINFKGHKMNTEQFPRLPEVWNHFCITVKMVGADQGQWMAYHNGIQILDKVSRVDPGIKWKSSVNLAMGSMVYNTHIHSYTSLNGIIADIEVFDREINETEVADLYSCNQEVVGTFSSWKDNSWTEEGNVTEITLKKVDLCPTEKKNVMLLNSHATWYAAREMCRRFRGRLFLPNAEEISSTVMPTIQNIDTINEDRCGRVWFGATDELEEGVWRDSETDQVLNLTGLWATTGQPNGADIQNCLGIQQQDGVDSQRFDDGKCTDEACFVCNFPQAPVASLRGLCPEAMVTIDTFYTLLYDDATYLPYYKGFSVGTLIQYTESSDSWTVNLTDQTVVVNTGPNSIFTGKQTWELEKPICDKKIISLIFTVCDSGEFTCESDGACISMEDRCDQIHNCHDHSDEMGCRTAVFDDLYIPERPYFAVNPDRSIKRLEVTVNFNLLYILSISEIEQEFETQFEIYTLWNDPRLYFHNIREQQNINSLPDDEKNGVWVPKIVFTNTQERSRSVNDEKASIVVRRDSTYSISDITVQNNIHLYEGKDNRLVMDRDFYATWICVFHMAWYPFDSQTCSLVLGTTAKERMFVDLKVGELQYQGPEHVATYVIRKTTFDKSEEELRVNIMMKRDLMGPLMTVYVPTIICVLITYMTNFYKPYFFEAKLSVNLTVLLVMATMFVSVSYELPSTSYIKMVDIWLISNLIYTFAQVTLDTVVDYHREEDEEEREELKDKHGRNRVDPEDADMKRREMSNRSALESTLQKLDKELKASKMYDTKLVSRKENEQVQALKEKYKEGSEKRANRVVKMGEKIGKVVFPIIYSLFVLSYWIVGIVAYNTSD